jgi:Formyl transferase
MLKTVFFGLRFPFNEVLVDWLSRRSELVGVVWTDSVGWQRSLATRVRFARRRIARYGIAKVLNETLLYFWLHSGPRQRDDARIQRELVAPYVAAHGPCRWDGAAIETADVNAGDVINFLRECAPDIAFAACIPQYFSSSLRQIPRHGVLLWHEGITPEYKGLYAPFWALHELDVRRVGCTVLRMNDYYDGGEPLLEATLAEVDPTCMDFGYLGHRAILETLPGVELLLTDLERGVLRQAIRDRRIAHTYTYPGLSDFLRLRVRARRFREQHRAGG